VKRAGIAAVLESAATACMARACIGPPFLAEASFPGRAASVPAARRFALGALADCPRADDLALAVTELASNAVVWSGAGEDSRFTARVRAAPRWARVEITDPGAARRRSAQSNGWGLRIVREVTDRSGTTHGPGLARTAWAEVTWPAEVMA
jgi:anti-sigma regulatory factor (Ser/Thr protein kinase)